MKYLLDTDHLSIIQRQTGQDYVNLSTHMAQYPLSDFAISVVTFHEQLLGSHTYISRARNESEVVKGYEIMVRLIQNSHTVKDVALIRIICQKILAIRRGYRSKWCIQTQLG